MKTSCAFKELPGRCSKTSSVLYPELCTQHVREVYGLDQKLINLPLAIAQSLCGETYADSLGILLVAVSNSSSKDDIVFAENDTIIAFSEYKLRAFDADTKNNLTEDGDIVAMSKQRAFSSRLATLRGLLNLASVYPDIGDDRRKHIVKLARQELDALKKFTPQYTEEEYFSNTPLYVSEKFRLSRPLLRYYRILQKGAQPVKIGKMFSSGVSLRELRNKADTEILAKMEYFLLHNSTNFLFGDFPAVTFDVNKSYQDLLAERQISCAREIYIEQSASRNEIRKLLRPTFLNQFDVSALGTTHGFILPVFTDIFSARALHAACFIAQPVTMNSMDETTQNAKEIYFNNCMYEKDDSDICPDCDLISQACLKQDSEKNPIKLTVTLIELTQKTHSGSKTKSTTSETDNENPKRQRTGSLTL